MSASRFGKIQKATALVPLALLSTAWTASLAGVGATSVAADDGSSQLPDGTSVPSQALDDPASYSEPGKIGLGVPSGSADQVIASASTNGIPSAALNAYQRAESVINAADKACHIPWQLIAAIGRVESDHGRYGGNTLGVDGISRPGIYGIALDGTHKTTPIRDTDAGQYDNDTVWDRAVGPMQFIPSTWADVGVDADGDAKRNPQDIDDAALAAAVYLCSGNDDLSTEPGQRASVFRYNHSDEYVDLVLSIMNAYLEGDYTSVPNYITSAVTFTPDYDFQGPVFIGPKQGTKGPKGPTGGTTTPPAEEPGEEPGEEPEEPGPVDGDPVGSLAETITKTTEVVKGIVKPPVQWDACIKLYTTPAP
jgi:membrane-bound lytic murein transglycosylase B